MLLSCVTRRKLCKITAHLPPFPLTFTSLPHTHLVPSIPQTPVPASKSSSRSSSSDESLSYNLLTRPEQHNAPNTPFAPRGPYSRLEQLSFERRQASQAKVRSIAITARKSPGSTAGTRSGRGNVELHANMVGRPLWTPEDGDGVEGPDVEDWKFFDADEATTAAFIAASPDRGELQCLRGRGVQNSTIFPKRVRLSDSAMGLVISIGLTAHRTRDWWPLNFNATGYALGQPQLAHMGHAFKVNEIVAQFGSEERSMYFSVAKEVTAKETRSSPSTVLMPKTKEQVPSCLVGLQVLQAQLYSRPMTSTILDQPAHPPAAREGFICANRLTAHHTFKPSRPTRQC